MRSSNCKRKTEVINLIERHSIIEVQSFNFTSGEHLRSGFDFAYGLCDICVVVRYQQRMFLLPKKTFNSLDQLPSFALFLTHTKRRVKYYKIDKEVLDVCSKC